MEDERGQGVEGPALIVVGNEVIGPVHHPISGNNAEEQWHIILAYEKLFKQKTAKKISD
jgi:hypothetical protein